MSEEVGLRQRKKAETRQALWHAAVGLFLERGYDNVSIAEIAAAANVSKMTVFNYFSTKDDLVFGPMEEHIEEYAKVVRSRATGESVVAALRRHWLDRLAARDPITGLNDSPGIAGLQRLILQTPSLMPRLYVFVHRSEEALIEALEQETDRLTARLAASQITSVQGVLLMHNLEQLLAGRPADDVHAEAVANAQQAFDVLAGGIGYL